MKSYEGRLNSLEIGPDTLMSWGCNYKSISVGDAQLRRMTATPIVARLLSVVVQHHCTLHTVGDEIVGLTVARTTFYCKANALGLLALFAAVASIGIMALWPDASAGPLYRLLLSMPFMLVIGWLLPWHLAVRKLSGFQNATGV